MRYVVLTAVLIIFIYLIELFGFKTISLWILFLIPTLILIGVLFGLFVITMFTIATKNTKEDDEFDM